MVIYAFKLLNCFVQLFQYSLSELLAELAAILMMKHELHYYFCSMLQITSTMVMSTFLSAPLMFISAQMSLLHYSAKTAIDFIRVLKDAMVDVSGTSLPFGVSCSCTAYRFLLAAERRFIVLSVCAVLAVWHSPVIQCHLRAFGLHDPEVVGSSQKRCKLFKGTQPADAHVHHIPFFVDLHITKQ